MTGPLTEQDVIELKCWPQFFAEKLAGRKWFELRKDDRPYAVGVIIREREWDPATGNYTGRTVDERVTYVLRGSEHLASGYVALGTEPVGDCGVCHKAAPIPDDHLCGPCRARVDEQKEVLREIEAQIAAARELGRREERERLSASLREWASLEEDAGRRTTAKRLVAAALRLELVAAPALSAPPAPQAPAIGQTWEGVTSGRRIRLDRKDANGIWWDDSHCIGAKEEDGTLPGWRLMAPVDDMAPEAKAEARKQADPWERFARELDKLAKEKAEAVEGSWQHDPESAKSVRLAALICEDIAAAAREASR